MSPRCPLRVARAAAAVAESLERRLLMAVIPVTRTDDPVGPHAGITLRDAITLANLNAGADEIVLSAGLTYELQIPGDKEDANAVGDLDIASNRGDLLVRVAGAAGSTATVNGNDVDRVFDVHSGGTAAVTFDHLLVVEGRLIQDQNAGVETGGGIRARHAGRLVMNACRVESCDAGFDQFEASVGGGLARSGGGATDLIDCIFQFNIAQAASSVYHVGGGAMTVLRGTIQSGACQGPLRMEGTSLPFGGGFVAEGSFFVRGLSAEGSSLDVTGDGTIEDSIFLNGGARLVTDGNVVLNRVRISGGTTLAGGSVGLSHRGGDLILNECVITGNHNRRPVPLPVQGDGGGIAVDGTPVAPGRPVRVLISRTEISGNTAGRGGGIFIGSFGEGVAADPPVVVIVNSTISSNSVTAQGPGGVGAGIYAGGVGNVGPGDEVVRHRLDLVHVTLTDELVNDHGRVNVANSVFAAADAENYTEIGFPTASAGSLGGNVSDDDSMSAILTAVRDRNETDPLLQPLDPGGNPRNNGGISQTRALLPGSPAIDNAVEVGLTVDQRGFPRPTDGDGDGVARGDSGAFEAPSVLGDAFLMPDPLNPSATMLRIVGRGGAGAAAAADSVAVQLAGAGSLVVVTMNGQPAKVFPLASISRIAVAAGEGNDVVAVAPGVTVTTLLDGGVGNDLLQGGGGPDLMLGNDGDDLLVGGGGRDVLIGGVGLNALFGGAGDDVLVAGATFHDYSGISGAGFQDHRSLLSILRSWQSTLSYETRTDNLLNGVGSPTLHPLVDTRSGELLVGGEGLDFFYYPPGDVSDQNGTERGVGHPPPG